jgi:hypothetical protein
MNYKVFISYSGEDNNMAEYVFNCLRAINEITPYKAERYQEYGKDFTQRIQQELSSSHFMVVLLTENGKGSQWVNQEIGFAQCLRFQQSSKKSLLIIPISYSNVELRGLITKHITDFLFIDKWGSFKLVVANIISTIRKYNGKGLEAGNFHLKLHCTNCLPEKGLPYEWQEKIPDHESMVKAVDMGRVVIEYVCPQCGTKIPIDIRTMLPYEDNEPFQTPSSI